MATYSLLDEAWIPVRPTLGGAVQFVGLRDVLLRAREYERIDDPSPLVTVALYRLCMAVLHRALRGPQDAAQAAEWYKHGFPQEAIEQYLSTYAERFDLFHPKQPFMQDWNLSPEAHDHHWSLIASEHGSYNTNFLFGLKKRIEPTLPEKGHLQASQSVLGSLEPDAAARHLLQHLAFALGGRTTGVSESQADSPAASTALILADGDNLHETFCLNLLPYSNEMAQDDLPPWEWMATDSKARFTGKHALNGFADRYAWLSRGVRLQPSADNSVTWVAYGGGVTPFGAAQGHYLEPMAAYVSDAKDELRPIRLDPDKLLWRDFTALLPGGKQPPLTVSHAAQVLNMVRERKSSSASPVSSRLDRLRKSGREYAHALPISVYGISRKQQKIELYRQEQFTLPEVFIADPKAFTNLVSQAIADAEEGAMALRRAVRLMCWLIVTTEADRGKEGRKPDEIAEALGNLPDDESSTAYKGKEIAKKVARLYRQLPSQDYYWSTLDPAFRHFLATAYDADAPAEWCQTIVQAARFGWRLALDGLGEDANVLRANAVAESLFNRLLSPLRQKANSEVVA